jgi:hypothetical protein
VQVHYGEGVAIRIGPEPCVGTREGAGEASVGEHIGQPWSRESLEVLGADVVKNTEGKMDEGVIASSRPTRRGPRPWHVWKLFAREPGDLGFGQRGHTAGPHREDEESKPTMHEPEKSDSAIVATKPANKRGDRWRSRWSEGWGPGGTWTSKARAGHRTGKVCHRRWAACGKSQRAGHSGHGAVRSGICVPASPCLTSAEWADTKNRRLTSAGFSWKAWDGLHCH